MPTLKKRSHNNQDPRKNHEGEKRKRRRKNTDGSFSKKDKASVDSSNYERFVDADEPQSQKHISKDQHLSYLKLGPLGRNTILTRYFFNNNLEYIKHRNTEKKYAFSLSKIKAARYEEEGIEELIPYLWSSSIQKYDKDAALIKIISVKKIVVDKKYGYGYLKEILVMRVDQKDYVFMESDFPWLNLKDIEDMYLFKIQDKIYNSDGVDEYDLINALLLYFRRIVIKKRVEDIPLGLESYKTNLNLTKPQLFHDEIQYKHPYTTMSDPRGVVYLNKDKNGKLDRCEWIKKDVKRTTTMIKKIEETLKERQHMRRLESFVGGRRMETDYRLLVRLDAVANTTPIVTIVTKPTTKEKTPKEADATPRENIQDFFEEHYEDILPVIMDKIRRDKRKEVHARLDFEESPKKRRIIEGSQNSSARTLSARAHSTDSVILTRQAQLNSDRKDQTLGIFSIVEAALAGGALLTEIVLGGETSPVVSKSHMTTPAPPMGQGPNMDTAAMETTPVMRKRGGKVNLRHPVYQRAAPAMRDTRSQGGLEDYVKNFQAAAQVERWPMPTWCHMFNSTLIGAARVWFDELPPESIDGYKDLKAAFLAYFMQQKKYVKDPVEIHNIKQRDEETIEEFMERFKVKIGRIKGAPECMWISGFMHGVNNPELTKRLNEHVPKTMEEMMITTTAFIRGEAAAAGKKKGHTSWRTQDQSKRHGSEWRSDFRGVFKLPPPMVTPVEKRSSNKFCDFHNDKGHSTDEWREQPKVGKKEVPAKDKSMAIYMIQPWHRVTRKKITQSFEWVSEITFPSLTSSSGTEGPLVIEAEIGGHMIHRMYVDGVGAIRGTPTLGITLRKISAMANTTPIVTTVTKPSTKEKTPKEADATPRVNIQDFFKEHYKDILPVIMHKIRHDKRKEVHARAHSTDSVILTRQAQLNPDRTDQTLGIFPTVEAALAGGTLLTEIILGAETAHVVSKSHMTTPAPPMGQGPNMDTATTKTTPVMRKRGGKVNRYYPVYQRAAPAIGDTGSQGQKDTSLRRWMTWRFPGYAKRWIHSHPESATSKVPNAMAKYPPQCTTVTKPSNQRKDAERGRMLQTQVHTKQSAIRTDSVILTIRQHTKIRPDRSNSRDLSHSRSRPRRRDSSNRDHPRSRDRSRGVEESYDSTRSSYRTGTKHGHRDHENHPRYEKKGRESKSLLSRVSKSGATIGAHGSQGQKDDKSTRWR
ncbi:reverse transcriptase domain-containing protein [Tanacetum coccineum]